MHTINGLPCTNPDTKVRFHASGMIMNIHSDASNLSEAKACSRACKYFFVGWLPNNGKPIKLNGAFRISATILRFVIASVTKAELGALYHNCQTGIVFCQMLEVMGHPQPKIPVHCNNTPAVGIANNMVKHTHSWSMELRFFWISDIVAQDMYALCWHPGQENLADYQSKHHTGAHYVAVHPWYLHMNNSPQVLPRALAPRALKGCVGTLDDGYIPRVPVLQAPQIQSSEHVTCSVTDSCDAINTCYLEQVPQIPTWHDLARLLASISRTTILPILPVWLM
jgi:hypothetical protein